MPLVEEGFAKHKITREVIDIYLSDMRESDIDTLILGCTHYPLLRSTIREYMGEKIHLVNPAYETAMDLKRLLEEEEMLRDLSLIHIYILRYGIQKQDKERVREMLQFANAAAALILSLIHILLAASSFKRRNC